MSTRASFTITAVPQLGIVWGLSVIVVLFFMLININTDVEFKSTIVFLTVLIASIMVTILLVGMFGKYLKGKQTKFFFAQSITIKQLILYVGIGLGGAFGWVTLVNLIGIGGIGGLSATQMSGLASLWGSGMIFGLILIKSRSILAPWLAHGIFNAIVFALKKTGLAGDFINTQSLPIPEIGLQLTAINQIATESIFQIFLVSLAEEHYKVLLIAIFLVAFKNTFENMTLKVFFALSIAVFTWGILHLLANLTQ